jgi:hypothetical protein
MYPEVENYATATQEAESVYNQMVNTAQTEYYASTFRDRRELHDARLTIARHERRVAIQAAWDGLKMSEDKLVVWIAEHCQSHFSYAVQVLEILPATSAEIQALALEKDWCDTFDTLLDQAVEAGVLEDASGSDRPRNALTRWFRNNISSNRNNVDQLLQFVDQIVAAEKAAQAEQATDETEKVTSDTVEES